MQVIHLANSYRPHIGGVETHLQHLIQIHAKKKITSIVLTPIDESFSQTKNEENAFEKVFRFPVSHRSGWMYKLSVWRGIWRQKQFLLSSELIHVHDVFWWLIPFLPLLWLRKIPVYMTFHGYEGSEKPRWNQVFWHMVANMFSQGSICIGGFHQKWYHVRPTFVSFGAATPPSKSKSKKKNAAIYLGRLSTDVGILQYLEALVILKKMKITIEMDVYGDGPLRFQAESFVKKHRLKVHFFGFQLNASKHLSKYQYAFVSRHLAIIEALAAGSVSIAQYSNEIKHDYLKLSPVAQWISIAKTPEEIAQEIQKNIRLNNAAVTWAKKQTWQSLADLYLQLWHKKK